MSAFRIVFGFFFTVISALALASAAEAKRVALIIGNSAYAKGPLANPARDANAIAQALRAIGFDSVALENDLSAEGMRRALRDFARVVTGSDVAVVYYAGHGTEVDGRNYLVPTDAQLERASDLDFEAIRLDNVLKQTEGAKQLRLVILDACRNNIFPLAGGTRSQTRGLARVEPQGNMLVAYAAREGTVAQDGDGANSPFTGSLARHIATPGLDVRLLLGRVRDDVFAATQGEQQPAIYGTLGGQEIYLRPPEAVAATAPPPAAEPPRAEPPVAAKPDVQTAPAPEAGAQPFPLDQFPLDQLPPDHPLAELFKEANKKKAASGGQPTREEPLAAPRPAPEGGQTSLPPDHPLAAFFNKLQELQKQQAPPGEQQSMLEQHDGVPPGLVPYEPSARNPGDTFRDCADCPEMVVVPAGRLLMGSTSDNAGRHKNETPQHEVTFRKPFAVGKYEVTFAEWDACVAAGACERKKDEGRGRGKQPVINVSWDDAHVFLAWLSRTSGKSYRLPSEAEWEYAARAGTTSNYHFGDDAASLGDYAWYAENSRGTTHPVGQKKANAFGLYDTSGNVEEWVEDCYESSYRGAPVDGSAWTSKDCLRRVTRGGPGAFNKDFQRPGRREANRPSTTGNFLGFRVARSLDN